MRKPPNPKEEKKRLLALKKTGITKGVTSTDFDRIVQLAINICQVEQAYISVVDQTEVWTLAVAGGDTNVVAREDSICSHTIAEAEGTLTINDASLDSRFKETSIYGSQFYWGIAIQDENDYRIATLCVFHQSSKTLSENQIESLKLLAGQVSSLMLSFKHLKQVETTGAKNRKKENRLTELLGRVGDLIFKLDGEGRIHYVNTSMINLTGRKESELLGMGFWDLVAPNEKKRVLEHYSSVLKEQKTSDYFEFQAIATHGLVWIGQNAELEYEDGKALGAYMVARDISELYTARARVEQSEERYRLLSENSRDIISLIDLDLRIQFISSSVTELLGYGKEELLGTYIYDTVHPGDVDTLNTLRKKELAEGKEIRVVTYKRRKKDGSYLWMESIIKSIYNSEEEITGYQINSRDITRRKIDEEQINQKQAKLEALIENTSDAMCVLDTNHRFVSFNLQYEAWMKSLNGFTPVLGEKMDYKKIDLSCKGFKSSVSKALEANIRKQESHLVELDEVLYYLDCFFNPVVDKANKVVGLAIRIQDITERELEKQKAEKHTQSLAELHQILTISDLGLNDQIKLALSIGLDYLNLDLAIISRIEEEEYVVANLVNNLEQMELHENDVFDLGQTYCSITYTQHQTLVIDAETEKLYLDHPCYQQFGLKAYVGTTYYVNGEKKGTINFSSPYSVGNKYSTREIEFIEVLSKLVGFLIERNEHQDQLLTDRMILRAFVFSAPAAIAMFNDQMEYLAMSNQWIGDYQLDPKKVHIGEPFDSSSPVLSERWKATFERCLAGKVERSNGQKISKEGQQDQWMKWEIRPWIESKGKIGGFVMFTEDITKQRIQQRELKAAKEEAERASLAKEQFLAAMSHEIRTPLNAIIGVYNILSQTSPRKDQLENLNLLKFSSENLLSLISDVLDFSKIEAGKVVLESADFSLKKLLMDVKHSMNVRAKEKGLDLVLKYVDDLPDVLLGDALRISQVMLNLMSNAIKFTHYGYVKLEVELLRIFSQTCYVRIIVEDTGIGIEETKLSHVFNDFEQGGEDVTRKYGGTGLGLAISQRLIALMGSEIHVSSQLNIGTKFSFDLELQISSTNTTPIPPKLKTTKWHDFSQDNIHILAAEDNRANSMILKQMMNLWGIKLDLVVDGKIAVEKAQQKRYDLILMDLQMPEMDGYTATKTIRKLPREGFRNVPIVALSAFASTEVLAKVKAAGMNGYLSKPIKVNDLQQVLFKYGVNGEVETIALEKETNSIQYLRTKYPYLYQITGGDQLEIVDLIQTIIETIPEELQLLQIQLSQGQLSAVAETIHKIKPNIESMEWGGLFVQADQIEKAALSNNMEFLEANFEPFFEAVFESIEGIKADQELKLEGLEIN